MVSVTIINDEVLEGDEESFSGQLSLPSGSTGVVIGQGVSTATIEDEDGKIVLYIVNISNILIVIICVCSISILYRCDC